MDFNLFPVFVEIMRHRNISKAAISLGITQSAASNALSRLRYHLSDPLFVRSSRGVIPTEFALTISERIETSVEGLRGIGSQEDRKTVPLKEIKRRVRIVASDMEECLIVPKLVEFLSEQSLTIQLEIRPYNRKTIGDDFRFNRTDFVMAYLRDHFANVNSLDLLYQDFCCAVRDGHPDIHQKPDINEFIAQKHILVSPDRGGFQGVVDEVLRKKKKTRQVMISAPHFLSGCRLCSMTNHIITLPRFLAEQVAPQFGLKLYELPFKLEGFNTGMHWHQQLHNDPEHRTLRQVVLDLVKKHYHSI